jgi:DNA-binding response OmpR family regulator
MGATLQRSRSPRKRAKGPLPALPPQMRVLFIAARQRIGGWLAESLAAEPDWQVKLDEAPGRAAGLERLRDEVFDLVLVGHEPGGLNAVGLVEGCRLSGADEPIIVLGQESEQEMIEACFEAGADAYLCVHTATTRSLLWLGARAIERHQLRRENERLGQAERTRLQREHEEASHLLEQQRAMLADLTAVREGRGRKASELEPGAWHPAQLPHPLVEHYRQLLRTYVIMGSGNLACELAELAKLLVAAGFTARQTMQLHLNVLEELVRGLGSRSSRHVMTRADLLMLEVLVHLAEGYRCRYRELVNPPRQMLLPGVA